MFSLPVIDYSPLTKKFVSTKAVKRELAIKHAWLPDSHYIGNHPPFSLGEEEIRRAAHFYEFALTNNFGFIGNLPDILPFPKSYFHSLATLNYATMITYGSIIRLETGWLEIGELRLDDASSAKSQDSRFTYAKVTMEQQLPHLTIDSLNAGLPTNSLGKATYRTESDEFHRHFKLYLDKDQAQAGLKVLSPDVMAALIDNFNQFDIEMRDHTMSFITYNRDLLDPDTLKFLLETIATLTKELSYQLRSPLGSNLLPPDIESYKKLYYSERSEPLESRFRRIMIFIILFMAGIAMSAPLIEWLLTTIIP